jgi:hypothetical protein
MDTLFPDRTVGHISSINVNRSLIVIDCAMKAITLLKKEIQVQASILFQRDLFSFAPKLGQGYLLSEGVCLKMWPEFSKRILVFEFFYVGLTCVMNYVYNNQIDALFILTLLN